MSDKGPTITFHDSAKLDVVKSFDGFDVDAKDYITYEGERVESIRGDEVNLDNFGGFMNYEGDIVVLKEGFVEASDAAELERGLLGREPKTYPVE